MSVFTELLQSYKAAKLRSETTTEELGEQVWAQKTPEMTAKMEEFKQTQRQLMALEQRLGEEGGGGRGGEGEGEQVGAQKTPEMTAKMEEFKQTQRQLMALEQRLGEEGRGGRGGEGRWGGEGEGEQVGAQKTPEMTAKRTNVFSLYLD